MNRRSITMHPAVSRAFSNGTTDPALLALIAIRRHASQAAKAVVNAREDVAATGYTTSHGAPKFDEAKRLRAALDAGTLPEDLREMVAARLASFQQEAAR